MDQEASEKARQETDTETALAELYAHVQSMPESSRKKKLLKQVCVCVCVQNFVRKFFISFHNHHFFSDFFLSPDLSRFYSLKYNDMLMSYTELDNIESCVIKNFLKIIDKKKF